MGRLRARPSCLVFCALVLVAPRFVDAQDCAANTICEEMAILKAVLDDSATTHGWPEWPEDLTTVGGRGVRRRAVIEVSPTTALDTAQEWSTKRSLPISIEKDGESRSQLVPVELLESAVMRNSQPLSLLALSLPAGMTFVSPRWPPDYRITLSRPGVSTDGDRALVAVRVDQRFPKYPGGAVVASAFGYAVLLEKREGMWHVIGHNVPWLS